MAFRPSIKKLMGVLSDFLLDVFNATTGANDSITHESFGNSEGLSGSSSISNPTDDPQWHNNFGTGADYQVPAESSMFDSNDWSSSSDSSWSGSSWDSSSGSDW